jgi:sporulation protein YunB
MRHRFRRRTKFKILGALVILLLVVILIFGVFSIRLMPVIKTMAINNARTEATMAINNAAGKVLKEQNIDYDKLMTLEKDGNGNITAVKADALQINMLKYEVTNEVVKEINAISSNELSIPIGTIIGGQIFSGLGPRIEVTVEPVGSVETNIDNEFTSTGINQTRQEVMLDVKASITIIVSSYNVATTVDSNFDIADTVIVGNVPSSYFVVNGDSSGGDADKLFAYSQNQNQNQSKSGK